jgi:hypothetical protein
MTSSKKLFPSWVGCRAEALVACWFVACAAPAPPPPAPPPAPVAPAPVAPAASATPVAPEPAATPAPAEAPSADNGAAEAAKQKERRQSPVTMLTARDVAFLVDYANSGVRESAEADCDKEAKGDPQAKGTCLEKAREKFLPDVLRFKKDDHGKVSLLVYKRSGSTLREIYVGAIEFIGENDEGVQLKFLGREKGMRPLFKSSPSKITVPNDYSIEIEDPLLGKLTYNAKIGLVAAD